GQGRRCLRFGEMDEAWGFGEGGGRWRRRWWRGRGRRGAWHLPRVEKAGRKGYPQRPNGETEDSSHVCMFEHKYCVNISDLLRTVATCGRRQLEGHRRPLPRRACNVNRPFVGFHHTPRQHQPQAHTSGRARAAAVGAEEGREDLLHV